MTDLFTVANVSVPTTDAPPPALRSSASLVGGRLKTRCAVPGCPRPAVFGVGVTLRRAMAAEDRDARLRALGTWRCAEHGESQP